MSAYPSSRSTSGVGADATMLRYHIDVRGRIDDSLGAMFDNIEAVADEEITHIMIEVRDRSELHGILNRLHTLGVDVLSVKLVNEPPERSDENV